MEVWVATILVGAFVSAVIALVGRLAGDRLTSMTRAIEVLTASVGLTREQYVETRSRAEEAHRRIDEHVRQHNEKGF